MGNGSQAEGRCSENLGLQPAPLSLVLLVVLFSHVSREARYCLYDGQRRLVLSEVCAWRYGAGGVRERSARVTERIVGRSAAGAAAGVAQLQSLPSFAVRL